MHVVITGANRGIGLELAKIYESQGSQVSKTSRKAMHVFVTIEVYDPASHKAFASSLDGAPVDLYIANAGINIRNDESVTTGYAADEWAQTFQTNVTGVFSGSSRCYPPCAPRLRRKSRSFPRNWRRRPTQAPAC